MIEKKQNHILWIAAVMLFLDVAYITVHVINYTEIYAENMMADYIIQNISDDMTLYEKLEKIAQFIAERFDYNASASSYLSMIIKGGGDCWASTSMVIHMCDMIGIEAWGRNAKRDSGAGSNHRNAIVYGDGKYYIVEAGFAGTKPRYYEIREKDKPFSYYRRSGDDGWTIYQYDGKNGTGTLVVPEMIENRPVTALDDSSLSGYSFSEIVLPDTLRKIGDSAFSTWPNLTSIYIPANVESLGQGILGYCSQLEKITIDPANQYYTAVDGIIYSKDMTQVIAVPTAANPVLPDTVTTIGPHAFWGNSNLTSIQLPSSVTKIGTGAFYNITKLSNLILPESLTAIEYGAFKNCSNIQNIWYAGTQEQWNQIEIGTDNDCLTNCPNIIFESEGSQVSYRYSDGTLTITGSGVMYGYASEEDTPWAGYRDSITSLVIEDGITAISDNAFRELTNLKSVRFPETLVSVGRYAFYNCTALESIDIPESVSIIREHAFQNCSNLAAVTLPEQMELIGTYAFSNCTSLTSFIIPEGITEIAYGTFNNCYNLITITLPTSLVDIGGSAFIYCSSLKKLDAGETALETIGQFAFYDNYYLRTVILPDTLSLIDYAAFGYCSGIKNVWYAGTEDQWNQITIGSNNTYLTNCPNKYFESEGPQVIGTASIPMYVGQKLVIPGFDNADITIDTTYLVYIVTVSGHTITAEKDGARRVHVDEGGETVMDYYVTVYSNPAILSLPADVVTIEEEAFEGADLQFVELGSKVQRVEADAFTDSGLMQIIVPGKKTVFDAGAFGDEDPLIVCVQGSAAEAFAEQNGYTYMYMQ